MDINAQHQLEEALKATSKAWANSQARFKPPAATYQLLLTEVGELYGGVTKKQQKTFVGLPVKWAVYDGPFKGKQVNGELRVYAENESSGAEIKTLFACIAGQESNDLPRIAATLRGCINKVIVTTEIGYNDGGYMNFEFLQATAVPQALPVQAGADPAASAPQVA